MQLSLGARTEIYQIDLNHPNPEAISRAAEIVASGGIVVYPTDTLYGFGVNARNQIAMGNLYRIKGRNDDKPVSLMVKNTAQIEDLAGKLNLLEKNLCDLLFPGKVTLVLRVKKELSLPKLGHQKKIGFRIPDNKICSLLISEANTTITSTSVNLASGDALNSAAEIKAVFDKQVDLILDAGTLAPSKGSTVLDLSTEPATVLREGDITIEQLEQKLGYKLYRTYPDKYVITFVCSGNICRSPMAAGILRKMAERTIYRDSIEVNSAGTLNINNSPATLQAIDIADQEGINISKHKSQGINEDILRRANLIICMALDHHKFISQRYPQYRHKVILLKQWLVAKHLSNPSIADPIGHSFAFYERIFNEISIELKRVLPEIIKQVKEFKEKTVSK